MATNPLLALRNIQPGLFNNQPAEREDPGARLSVLERFLGGSADPMLNAQQNDEAAKQGMILAGLQMLLSANPRGGARARNLAGILAEGALTGQAGGMAARQGMAQAQMQAQVGQLLTQGALQTRQEMEQAVRQLAAVGAVDEAKLLIQMFEDRPEPAPSQIVRVKVDDKARFAKRMPDGSLQLLRGAAQDVPGGLEEGQPVELKDEFGRVMVGFELGQRDAELRQVGNDLLSIDPTTLAGPPQVLGGIAGGAAEAIKPAGAPFKIFSEAEGRDIQAVMWTDGMVRKLGTNEVVSDLQPALSIPPDKRIEAQNALGPMAQDLDLMKRFGRAPGAAATILSGTELPLTGITTGDIGGRAVARMLPGGEESMQFASAGSRFIARVVRILSGAQASDQERANLEKVFIPRPGESDEQVRIKMSRLQSMVAATAAIAQGRPAPIPSELLNSLEIGSEAYNGLLDQNRAGVISFQQGAGSISGSAQPAPGVGEPQPRISEDNELARELMRRRAQQGQ